MVYGLFASSGLAISIHPIMGELESCSTNLARFHRSSFAWILSEQASSRQYICICASATGRRVRMVLEEPADSDILLSTWLHDYIGSAAPADSSLTKLAYPDVQGSDATAEFDEFSATFNQPTLDGVASMALDLSSEPAEGDKKREVKTERDARMAANNRYGGVSIQCPSPSPQ